MARDIKKGITIEFRGETVSLENALKRVKRETNSVTGELRAVDRALKFNPRNSELLAQKQSLLKRRVEETTAKVQQLKRAQAQLDAKGVDKSSAEYQKLRREIIVSESQLKHFNKELIKFGSVNFTKTAQSIRAVGDRLTTVNRRARQVAGAFAGIALFNGFERLKTLDEVRTELQKLGITGKELETDMDAATGAVSGTKFALTDMAKVMKGAIGSGATEKYALSDYLGRVADLAQLAGIDVQKMGAMMNKAYSKGRVDARLLNQLNANGIPIYKLLQNELGVTADELTKLTRSGKVGFDDLYRATEKYKGLAQEMGTETFSGAFTVLGQQAGLIGADFLSGVYEPIKSGVKGLVATIKDLRADGTFEAWGKSLGETVNYFVGYIKNGQASMAGLSTGAQTLITDLWPLISVLSMAGKAVANLPLAAKQFGVFMALFGSPALKGIATVTQGIGSLKVALSGLNTVSAAARTGLASMAGSLGIMAAVSIPALGAIRDLVTGTNDYTRAYAQNASARKQAVADTVAQSAAAEVYAGKLTALMGKEQKSATDKQLIKTYVDQLNSSVEGLGLAYDEQTGKLNKSTQAIYAGINAMKAQALQAAYQKQMTAAASDLADAQVKAAKEQEHLTAVTAAYNQAVEQHATGAIAQYGQEITRSKRSLDGYNKVIKQSEKEINAYATAYSKSTGKAKKSASDMATSVKKSTSSLPAAGKKGGASYGDAVRSGINSKQGAVKTAGSNLKKAADSGKWPSGKKGAQSWVDSITGVLRNARSTVASLAAQIKAKMDYGVTSANGYRRATNGSLNKIAYAGPQLLRVPVAAAPAQSVTNTTTNAPTVNITVTGQTDPAVFAGQLAAELNRNMKV